MEKKKVPKNESGGISRREFLKDAGLVVGGAAIGSTVLLAACGGGEGETATVTKTSTVTTTAQVGTATQTVTTTAGAATVTTTVAGVTKFICPIDGLEFDTLSALQAHFASAHPEEAIPGVITLNINGSNHVLQVEPNWTLAYVIREKLFMTGTKRGCRTGDCGYCTVIMDGRPVVSCLVLAIEADGLPIATVEGLAVADKLHPLQQAFIDEDALQCGICTPGILMTAKALLDFKSKPTLAEIKEFMAGSICRCGCYTPIIKAIQKVAG